MRRPRWTGWSTGPKAPPPADGLKIKKAGTTWWGKRWIAALEVVLGGDAGRLARGRTYARAGRTHDLLVEGGRVTAKVTGSRPRPYDVTIELVRPGDAEWARAVAGLVGKAQFAATLLAGEMPPDIDDVFRAAGAGLFPASRAELKTSCSCPDWGDPCKHVAATHYVLGEALDRDPFLLFELRGRAKAEVLEALRRARGGGKPPPKARRAKPRKTSPAEYDAPRAALPAMHFSFEEPPTHGAVLRQLGAPAGWSDEHPPAETLGPLVRAAAELARQLALAEPAPPPTDAPAKRKPGKPR